MVQIASNPILIKEDPGSRNDNVPIGSSVKRKFYVINTSNQKVEIDLWISPTDQKSEPLLRWCVFSDKNPLNLDVNESKEVTLNFQIPLTAKPDLYNYEVLIESAVQYPGKIFRRPQQIRVLPSGKDSQWNNEPKFTIYPLTSSTHPKQLKSNEQLEFKVKVENRSKRVDRFYLSPELTPEFSTEWYTIKYPESELDIPGLVKETDGLELNPGQEGEITLILHPPQYTFAGNYCPTIRLISNNKENLVLLDILYLRILSDDRLDIQMYPPSRRIPEEKGEFEIELANEGNIKRELKVSINDEEGLFSYFLQPSIVEILPGASKTVFLRTEPKKWLEWRRHLRGKGLKFTFDIELENINQIILPETNRSPEIPQSLPQGKLVWQSRPWWVLWLLILLALLGIGGTVFVVWWTFLRGELPPEPAKVEKFEFKPIKKNQEDKKTGKTDGITLNWEITNRDKIKKITVVEMQGNEEFRRKNYIFENENNIPDGLKGKCELPNKNENQQNSSNGFLSLFQNTEIKSPLKNQDNKLTCNNIPTKANKVGNYNFKIEVFSTQNPEQPSSSQITDTITIKPATPLPLPKIINLSSSQPIYEEVDPYSLSNSSPLLSSSPVKKSPSGSVTAPIRLNWEITTPEHIQELRLIGKTPDGSVNSVEKRYKVTNNRPEGLEKECPPRNKADETGKLTCRNVPVNASKAGEYIFTLTVIPKTTGTQGEGEKEKTVIEKQTPTIKVKPLPLPQIDNFSPVQPTYQEIGVVSQTDDSSIQTNISKPPILLNWQIKNSNQIKELRLIGINNGSLSESTTYSMSREGLPIGLDNCEKQQNILNCRNISTKAIKPGNYTFKMVLIPKQGEPVQEIVKATEAIKIESRPTPIKIDFFRINGQEVNKDNPKQTFVLNKERSDANITISWQVKNGEDIKVEILPAPGVVSNKGSIDKYPLSKPPSNEVITLKVTNKAGEEKTRSVVIETIEAIPPKQSQTSNTDNNSGNNSGKSNRSVNGDRPDSSSTSDKLSPIELPPKSN